MSIADLKLSSDGRYKITMTFTPDQIEPIETISNRLRLPIPATMRYLLMKSVESSLALNSLSEQTDLVSKFMNQCMTQLDESPVADSNTATEGQNNAGSPSANVENLNPDIPFPEDSDDD